MRRTNNSLKALLYVAFSTVLLVILYYEREEKSFNRHATVMPLFYQTPLVNRVISTNYLNMIKEDKARNNEESTNKRSMKQSTKAASVLAGILSVVSSAFGNASPAAASSLNDANSRLGLYGLPPVVFQPDGFSTLVSEYGRGSKSSGKTPVLIQFGHPKLWIEATTNMNNNGEAGTVSANDYIKGDSAFYFTLEIPSGERLTDKSTELAKKVVLASLSQKGDLLDNLKVKNLKLESHGKGPEQDYVIADISYDLNTEAGFLIPRKGLISMTIIDDKVHALVTASTAIRYKKTETSLRNIADSYRVYKILDKKAPTKNMDV